MKRFISQFGVFFLVGLFMTNAQAISTGEKASDFALLDVNGKEHRITNYSGKYVVLEWFNYDCPFVKKHYGSGNMQQLQAEYAEKGVIWLSINSSAPGKQGYYSAEEMAQLADDRGVESSAVLLDPSGKVGRLYGAKTTPHLFLINPEGVLIYQGAIDDQPSTNPNDISKAYNYLAAAIDQATNGESVETSFTQSYGCSVKY